jgi:hypothetical protein
MRGLRTVLLKIMLGTLALGAITGAAAFLLAAENLIGPLVGTAVVGATATALLMATTIVIDRPLDRPAGLLGAATIVLEFCGAMALIWLDAMPGYSHDFAAHLGETMACLAGTTIPVMAFLSAATRRPTRWCGRIGAAAFALVFVLWLLASWWPAHSWRDSVQIHLYGTGATVATFGAAAALTLLGFEKRDRQYWRWIGILAALAATSLFLCEVWTDWDVLELWPALLVSLSGLAAVPAYTALALAFRLPRRQTWLPILGSALASGAVLCLAIGAAIDRSQWLSSPQTELLGRGAGAFTVAAAATLLAVIVLSRLNKSVTPAPFPHRFKDLALTCPRCGKPHTLPLGLARCPDCGLEFHTAIVEPHCPKCDYLIYGPAPDRCPECGSRLPPWTGIAPEAITATPTPTTTTYPPHARG